MHAHTHTHPTALFPGLSGWASTRKVKPVWILLKQKTVSGSDISWAVCKSAPRSRQITTPAPHHSVFYRPDAVPDAQPTASKHWRQQLTAHAPNHIGCEWGRKSVNVTIVCDAVFRASNVECMGLCSRRCTVSPPHCVTSTAMMTSMLLLMVVVMRMVVGGRACTWWQRLCVADWWNWMTDCCTLHS